MYKFVYNFYSQPPNPQQIMSSDVYNIFSTLGFASLLLRFPSEVAVIGQFAVHRRGMIVLMLVRS